MECNLSVYMLFEAHVHPEHVDTFPTRIGKNLRNLHEFDGFEGLVKCWQNSADPCHYLIVERWTSPEHHRRYVAKRIERGEQMPPDMYSQTLSVDYFDDADARFLPETSESKANTPPTTQRF
jgi:heme-degrading monooxygenase HmoA